MDLLEQPEIRKTYNKCKYIVKLWEHKFQKEHKRVPSKLDIREASLEVRHAYRKYFQLKTQALEQSFMDIDMGLEDEVESTQLNSADIEENDQNELNLIEESLQENTANFGADKTQVDNLEYVWGAHLNKTKEEDFVDPQDDKTSKLNDATTNFTKRLFCGVKFTKRNPRKSLSFTQRKSENSITTDNHLSCPQLENTILSEETISNYSQKSGTSLSQDADSKSFSHVLELNLFKTDFKIVKPQEKIQTQSISIINNVLENNHNKQLKTYDSGWLERTTGTKLPDVEKYLLKNNQELSVNSYNFPSQSNLQTEHSSTTKFDYDSDVIESSEDESDKNPLSQSIMHIAKKQKVESLEFSSTSTNNLSSNKHSSFSNISDSSQTLNNSLNTPDILNVSTNLLNTSNILSNTSNNINSSKNIEKIGNSINTVNNDVEQETTYSTEHQEILDKPPKQKLVTKTSKCKPQTKTLQEKPSSSRRSSRLAKNKVTLQELSSEEEDPFASDNDSRDPEFVPAEDSKIVNNGSSVLKDVVEKEFPKKRAGKSTLTKTKKVRRAPKTPNLPKLPKTPKSTKIRKSLEKKQKEEEPKGDTEESNYQPYDLEFSVKPRIVAPRYNNIKTTIKERKINNKVEKSDIKKDENDKEGDILLKDRRTQAREKLQTKVLSGNLNENYVTINLKKKKFSRGKSGMNFTKWKKSQWKSKKKSLAGPDMDMGGCDGGQLTCFNCGQIGHFAVACKSLKGEGLLPLAAQNLEEPCPYPTLEEAAEMASQTHYAIRKPKLVLNKNNDNEIDTDENGITDDENCDNNEEFNPNEGDLFDDDDMDSNMLLTETLKLEEHIRKLDVTLYMDTVKVVKPFYELNGDNTVIDTPSEVYEALKLFGHTSFRNGQEQCVMRILSGQSTLVTLSTGSGKSLCYQLPAYLYAKREPCISLIISPLVSLMEDQVVGIPKCLSAACLHTNQTKSQRAKIVEALAEGRISVLLISPEAVVAGEKQSGFGSILRKLPPIAFACIDEAHCVSQWSHNFRPSYLMICRVLRESLGVKTILGLTATATRSTSDSIIDHLRIPDGRSGIISDQPLPNNLILTASKDSQRDRALLGLLLSDRFADCKSVIIYCTRRDECERIAGFLRTSLKTEKIQEPTDKKRKRVNLQAEPYHAGLSASRRRTIQNSFMSGSLRIVVATVAFGMGINKSDIRSVIHYNMPKSFESYVQEVGRAGRDGLAAHCHVFLDSKGGDENELKRHIHSNSIDRHVIRKLLQQIFIPCSCKGECPKHEVAFSISETVLALDIPEENISTLLCYLELHENKYIKLLSPGYINCKVISYGGPMQIRKAAKECPPLAMALALHKCEDRGDPNTLDFPVVDIASTMGWESGICKYKLKNLEWVTVNNQPKRSTLSVRFSNLGFRLLAPGNLTDDQLDEALDSIFTRVQSQEKTAILQLRAVHETFIDVATNSYRACLVEDSEEVKKLRLKVRDYFESPNPLKSLPEKSPQKVNEEVIIQNIRALIHMYRDNTFTGRAIARIFHGIQSPNYPAVIWGRCKFWRAHVNEDFHAINRIATNEILRIK